MHYHIDFSKNCGVWGGSGGGAVPQPLNKYLSDHPSEKPVHVLMRMRT